MVIHAGPDIGVIELIPVGCSGEEMAWECCDGTEINSIDDQR